MANIDSTPKDIPYSGDQRAEFQTRMGEYRRIRNLLNRAAGAARRRGDATSYISLVDLGAKRGIQVGGTDRVPRIQQTVLADMARDRENAIANAKAARKAKDIANQPMPEGPRVRKERERPKVNVEPSESDDAKTALQQTTPVDPNDEQFGLVNSPYGNPFLQEDISFS
tara:strand:+ start:101 stop:607 length:507 start_codon:yes stop_codon:yes gene_type:complete